MTSDKRSQLCLYNQIYREYYTYRYDSAMTYAKKGYELAAQLQDDYFINLNKSIVRQCCQQAVSTARQKT